MPLYDYQCRTCHEVTEVRHGFRETHEDPCPACGGELARVFNPAGIVFKGSGFYVTDSRTSSGSNGASASGSGDASSSASKDASPASAGAAEKSSPVPASSGEGGSKKSDTAA